MRTRFVQVVQVQDGGRGSGLAVQEGWSDGRRPPACPAHLHADLANWDIVQARYVSTPRTSTGCPQREPTRLSWPRSPATARSRWKAQRLECVVITSDINVVSWLLLEIALYGAAAKGRKSPVSSRNRRSGWHTGR